MLKKKAIIFEFGFSKCQVSSLPLSPPPSASAASSAASSSSSSYLPLSILRVCFFFFFFSSFLSVCCRCARDREKRGVGSRKSETDPTRTWSQSQYFFLKKKDALKEPKIGFFFLFLTRQSSRARSRPRPHHYPESSLAVGIGVVGALSSRRAFSFATETCTRTRVNSASFPFLLLRPGRPRTTRGGVQVLDR